VSRRVRRERAPTGSASRPPIDGTVAHCVVLALATVLSIWKPKGCTPFGRRRGRGDDENPPERGVTSNADD
jgi:hypothetical protein